MTGVPRHIAEHRLNVQEGCPLVRQKKRSQAPKRNKVIQEEVEKLIDVGIIKEAHYHSWFSNSVMVKKYDNSWRMCVDFKDLDKACPKDGYSLPEIDWKVESLCEYPFNCFLDAYKGYHQIKMAKEDEEKTTFITSQNLEVYLDDLVIKSRTEQEIIKDIEETFKTLREINMKLNPKKCTFRIEEGMFIGYKKCTKKSDFQWIVEAEAAFKQIELPTQTAPIEKEELIVYLAAAREAVSAVLMTEREAKKMLIYFVSRALQAYPIIVIMDQPIKQVLSKPEIAGRLQKLSIELGEYDIQYKPRISVKGKILADFIVEQPEDDSPAAPMEVKEELPDPWTLFTDGSSCIDGFEAGLILTSPEGTKFTYALRFEFDATNNEPEYEALIADLRIAEQMGIKTLQTHVDSHLVANQVNGSYIAKEPVPRSENKKAGALSKIASTSFAHLTKKVLVEVLKEKSINEAEVLTIVEEEGNTWMNPIYKYLTKETLLAEGNKARAVRLKSRRGVDGVLDFSTIIAQQLQNLLLAIITQVGNHVNNQGNNGNQDGNVVNDNIQGDVRNVIMNNGRGGCAYKEFLVCNLRDFEGKGGAIAYTRWTKKMESVHDMSGCGANQKVKYDVGYLIGKALTWWNTQVQTRGRDAAIGISWENFKILMREKFCLDNEVQKLESEFWFHAMVGAGHAAYTDRFHELARLVPHLVTPEKNRIERYIYGLASQIRGMVAATEPTTIQSDVLKAGMLIDEAVRTGALKKNTEKRRNNEELSRDGKVKGDNKRSRTGRAFATTTSNPVKKEHLGTTPKCTTYNYHHQPEIPCRLCTNCNHLGHFAKDCKVGPRMVNPVNARKPTTARGACFECGGTDHYKAVFPRLIRGPE
ncbi:reverse transcriptase domain-containing protein [Tanacetum coccineum]